MGRQEERRAEGQGNGRKEVRGVGCGEGRGEGRSEGRGGGRGEERDDAIFKWCRIPARDRILSRSSKRRRRCSLAQNVALDVTRDAVQNVAREMVEGEEVLDGNVVVDNAELVTVAATAVAVAAAGEEEENEGEKGSTTTTASTTATNHRRSSLHRLFSRNRLVKSILLFINRDG